VRHPGFLRRGLCEALLLIGLLCGTPAFAAPAPSTLATEAARYWRDATTADVAAAYALLRDNHPGMVVEVGDEAFRKAVEAAHVTAASRASTVSSFEGYAATLAGFSTALGDEHISSRPVLEVVRPEWAGLLLSKRGEHWVVADVDSGSERLLGAELLSCDGRSPEDWARQGLGRFRVDWSVGAQQLQAAPWLLVDEHNPFTQRPAACDFDKGGKRTSLTLAWRKIPRASLVPRINNVVASGAAGFGVRAVGDGYWIALQSLGDPAAAVVAQVEAQAEAMRKARFVVLDMRGNGGGSSVYGDQIARAVMGVDFVDSMLGPSNGDCGEAWRVSDGNIAQLQHFVEVGPTRGPEFTTWATQLLQKAKAARAKGEAFTSPLRCAAPTPSAKVEKVASQFRGRFIVLTDNACFSSCLDVTDTLLRLGALQVGQTTNACTHYTEVREALLPSGLSWFSTLQGVAADLPARYGPFTPSVPYDGDIRDTPVLEQWILKLTA
jgi:Peptidase family S41